MSIEYNKNNKPICISFSAPIVDQTVSALMAAFANAVNKKHREIHLFLSTPGGTVSGGITVYNMIRALPVEMRTYNIGNINSIGNVVFQAGTRRFCAPAASFMFHGVGVDLTSNTRLEMRQLQDHIKQIENDQTIITKIIVDRTAMDKDAVNQLFLDMAYIGPEESLQCGITDEVIDVRLPDGMPIQQLIFQR